MLQSINLGTTPGDKTGTKARDAGSIINNNFQYLESAKDGKHIKSNESLSSAKRNGDILYGIIDQYTGEEITLSKVTGPLTIDGIIYFQLGSEYFIRNFDSINVKWFGAIGDGITDDSNALIKMTSSLKEGDRVSFEKNKIYYITQSINIYYGVVIEGNNATIKPSISLINSGGSSLYIGSQIASISSLTGLNSVKNSNSITLPSGITTKIGDLIQFLSNDISYGFATGLESFNYKHGQYSVVTKVTGQDIVLSTPFYENYNINSIIVNKGFTSCEVSGLNFDLTNTPNSLTYFAALNIKGTNVNILNCTFNGNDYAHTAIFVEGENFIINNNRVSNFFNIQGISGGGRLGYGVANYANNTATYNNTIVDCKHGYTTGPRNYAISGASIYGNTITENYSRTVGTLGVVNVTNEYAGSIDAHAGVSDVVLIYNNKINCQGRAFFIRNGKALIENNEVIQMNNPVAIIGIEEKPITSLRINKNTFNLLDAGTASIIGKYNSLANTTLPLKNIIIDNNSIVNGTIVFDDAMYIRSFENLTISNNICKNTNLISISTNSTNLTPLKNVDICGNKTISDSSADIKRIIRFESYTAGSKVSVFENINIYNNNIDSSLNSGSGYNIFFSNCTLKKLNIYNNFFKRGALVSDKNVLLANVNYTDVDFNRNILDDTFRVETTNTSILKNIKFIGNTFGNIVFREGTGGILNFINVSILSNLISTENTIKAIEFTCNTITNGWVNSTELLISDNTILSNNTTSCVVINSNSIGNKLVFINNILSRGIEENSLTFYAIPKNVIKTGVQLWKGNTIASFEGKLSSTIIPTSGSWTVSEIIYNSSTSESNNFGWLCTVSGTPGTFVPLVEPSTNLVHISNSETITGYKIFSTIVSAIAAIARGFFLSPTLNATANNDILVGMDVSPIYNAGSFTGIKKLGLRLSGIIQAVRIGQIAQYINIEPGDVGNENRIQSYSQVSSAKSLKIYASTDELNTTPTSGECNLELGVRGSSVIKVFSSSKNVGIQPGGTFTDTGEALQIGGAIRTAQYKLSALNTTPTSAAATGTLGEIRYDANYMYVCIATNTWKRSAITTW
jgi:hypothetical protein